MRYFDLQIAKRITGNAATSYTLSSNFQYTVGNNRAVRGGCMDFYLLF